ncbi:MAG: site-specific integrase [Acidaminococcales bacterium]|jgi:integrase|nr:site-specific integrase [Acidaminococcales bacterium]
MPAKIQKRGNNSYLLTVPGGYENGRQRKFTKTIKADNVNQAKKEYNLFVAECMTGKALPASTPKMTLQQFYAYWKDKYAMPALAHKTIACNDFVADRILAALGHLQIHKITPFHCLELLDQLRRPDIGAHGKPLSSATIHKHYALLNELLTYAAKWDFIPFNPLAKVDPPKRKTAPKELPSPDRVSLFVSLIMGKAVLKHQIWVLLAFLLGLRREEIFGLKVQDIDFAAQTLKISRAVVYVHGLGNVIKDTKTAAGQRVLSLPPVLARLLNEYVSRPQQIKVVSFGRWLFAKGNGEPGQPDAFNNFLKRFVKKHSLPGITPHLLRHMHGSYLMRSGIDLAATSHQLGHTKKSFTADTYIHVTERVETRPAAVMQSVFDTLVK